MATLFARRWGVLVEGSGAIATTDLRIAFRVRHTLEKEPNTADIKIYNLSETNRGKLAQKAMRVTLEAGYEGSVGIIFEGDSRTVDHSRDRVDWVTQLQCGDGEHAYQHARVNESLGPNTSITDAVKKVTTALGINPGNVDKAIAKAEGTKVFKNGLSLFGPASQNLDKLLKSAGLEWSIQKGALQVRKPDEPAQTEVYKLGATTGLIGSPDHAAPDKKGGPSILRVKSLLNPRLLPGHLVTIDSAGVKGEFLMRVVEHTGDSHGTDWTTNLECTARKV